MAKIKWDPRNDWAGQRMKVIEEPVVTDTEGKTKSRLRKTTGKKRGRGKVQTNQSVEDVHVSTVNWKGRRERGIDAY